MLERVDRVQMAAEVAREEASDYLHRDRFGYTGTPARARGSLTKPTTEAPS